MCRPRRPLTCARPVRPACTRCRWAYRSNSAENRSTKCGRSGRGPTSVMSPRRMFHSWGSSSSDVRRRKRPTGPTRSSLGDRPVGGRLGLVDRAHRPELEAVEQHPVPPDPGLPEDHPGPPSRRTASALHGDDRSGQSEQHGRRDDVEGALDQPRRALQVRGPDAHDRDRADVVGRARSAVWKWCRRGTTSRSHGAQAGVRTASSSYALGDVAVRDQQHARPGLADHPVEVVEPARAAARPPRPRRRSRRRRNRRRRARTAGLSRRTRASSRGHRAAADQQRPVRGDAAAAGSSR